MSPLRRPGHGCEDNTEIEWDGVDWIIVARNGKIRAAVSMAMSLLFI
jgi:hypothetical protein